MSLARFERMLAAYGSDPAAWPAREARQASKLLAQSGRAQTLMGNLARLEAIAAGTESFGPVPDGSVERVMREAISRIDDLNTQQIAATVQITPRSWWLGPAAGLAFASLLFFCIGLEVGAAHTTAQPSPDTAAKLIIDGPYRSFASL